MNEHPLKREPGELVDFVPAPGYEDWEPPECITIEKLQARTDAYLLMEFIAQETARPLLDIIETMLQRIERLEYRRCFEELDALEDGSLDERISTPEQLLSIATFEADDG